MKMATLHKQCKSGKGVKAPTVTHRRDAGAHLPKRRAVQIVHADMDVLGSTSVLNDFYEPVVSREIDTDMTVPRVLLVDRDPETAAALTNLLVPEAKLVHAANCAEARRLLDTQLFSMVIIDPSLPDGDGAAVINAVHHTPILLYSAREPFKHDRLPYLNKPYTTPRELWSTISRLLGIGGLLVSED